MVSVPAGTTGANAIRPLQKEGGFLVSVSSLLASWHPHPRLHISSITAPNRNARVGIDLDFTLFVVKLLRSRPIPL